MLICFLLLDGCVPPPLMTESAWFVEADLNFCISTAESSTCDDSG